MDNIQDIQPNEQERIPFNVKSLYYKVKEIIASFNTLKDTISDCKKIAGVLSQTTISSIAGSLIVGHKYIVYQLEAGDDFANVGYVSTGVIFTATGTTPTTWSNGSFVIYCTLSIPTLSTVGTNSLGTIVWSPYSYCVYRGTLTGAFKLPTFFSFYNEPNYAYPTIKRIDNNTIEVDFTQYIMPSNISLEIKSPN